VTVRLYDLAAEYAALLRLAEEGEDVTEALAACQDDIERKSLSILHVCDSLQRDVLACEAEIDRLKLRAARIEAQRERLHAYVLNTMIMHSVERINTPTLTIARVANPPKVVIVDADAIADEHRRPVPPPPKGEPDKKSLLAEWKATGKEPAGVRIERGERLKVS
jgi:hypothetical protein